MVLVYGINKYNLINFELNKMIAYYFYVVIIVLGKWVFMATIDVIVKPIIDKKSAKELQRILVKPSKKPELTKEAKEIAKKISFNFK